MRIRADRFEILRTRTPQAIAGDDFRLASVLAPIQERPDGDYLILTLRSKNLSSHSGQVAFPGGSVDPGDAGAVDTALRETHEEIGVDPGHVRIVGQLDQVFAGYNFLVTPFVGLIPYPYEFRPDPRETAAVFAVPVAALLKQDALTLDSPLVQEVGAHLPLSVSGVGYLGSHGADGQAVAGTRVRLPVAGLT